MANAILVNRKKTINKYFEFDVKSDVQTIKKVFKMLEPTGPEKIISAFKAPKEPNVISLNSFSGMQSFFRKINLRASVGKASNSEISLLIKFNPYKFASQDIIIPLGSLVAPHAQNNNVRSELTAQQFVQGKPKYTSDTDFVRAGTIARKYGTAEVMNDKFQEVFQHTPGEVRCDICSSIRKTRKSLNVYLVNNQPVLACGKCSLKLEGKVPNIKDVTSYDMFEKLLSELGAYEKPYVEDFIEKAHNYLSKDASAVFNINEFFMDMRMTRAREEEFEHVCSYKGLKIITNPFKVVNKEGKPLTNQEISDEVIDSMFKPRPKTSSEATRMEEATKQEKDEKSENDETPEDILKQLSKKTSVDETLRLIGLYNEMVKQD